ncbi:hypothetical protein [Propionibacterium freudenreichii]|uniref:hypothetical protein n=1 Tax=Propionibacterium freudenreichii TaxID=1744 RepID=UPI00101F1686|nr:hypothetical protein [Propionibacterium freudenreichii]MDK9295724.1 hypothetical protein [Propionibacterium freudenreichii]MDK9302380.1 hypothetical protein [Propionibacterium freudenreichii]MDK9319967.1 hypothetical protein [Propionibacterium freudenreichii]MDK9324334.1 hypothetical protein [Propionibacterium freudenreichii]MDK9340598.1 hypothetical protein [Propionibacterium freudenreichii]
MIIDKRGESPMNVRHVFSTVLRDVRSVDEAIKATSAATGRPICLQEVSYLGQQGPSGLLVQSGSCDVIQLPSGVSGRRRVGIIGHELGHLLLGHQPEDLSGLFSIDPDIVKRILARHHFDDRKERDAELIGTMLAQTIGRNLQFEGLWSCLS